DSGRTASPANGGAVGGGGARDRVVVVAEPACGAAATTRAVGIRGACRTGVRASNADTGPRGARDVMVIRARPCSVPETSDQDAHVASGVVGHSRVLARGGARVRGDALPFVADAVGARVGGTRYARAFVDPGVAERLAAVISTTEEQDS